MRLDSLNQNESSSSHKRARDMNEMTFERVSWSTYSHNIKKKHLISWKIFFTWLVHPYYIFRINLAYNQNTNFTNWITLNELDTAALRWTWYSFSRLFFCWIMWFFKLTCREVHIVEKLAARNSLHNGELQFASALFSPGYNQSPNP